MFVPRDALADMLVKAEVGGAIPEPAVETARASHPPDPIRYLPCPLCHTSMNRVNFGRVSGVIVDVCRKHGTWFDVGELTRVVAFVGSGGSKKTRAREMEDLPKKPHHQFEDPDIAAWRDTIRSMFFW